MSIGSTRAICQSERMKNAPLSSIRNIIAYSDKLEQEGRSIIHLANRISARPPTS